MYSDMPCILFTCISLNILTSLSRVRIEKLIVAQLVKNASLFIEPEVSLRVHKSLPLGSVLNQLNPAHIFPSYLRFII
jgi:hypothetical protein